MTVIQSIRQYLHRRKLTRLESKRKGWMNAAEEHRRHAMELGLRANYMDQFATPLAWGRTQNAANQQRHYERFSRDKAEGLRKEIEKLTRESP